MTVHVGVLANARVRARREHRVRLALGEHAPVDDDEPVEPVGRAVQVVRRHEHGQTVLHEAPDQFA